MNTHALRSSFVIFAGNKSTEAVMESIAKAMRHSRQYQQDIYDKMTTNKKVKLGVQNNSGKYYFKSSIEDSDKYSDKPSWL